MLLNLRRACSSSEIPSYWPIHITPWSALPSLALAVSEPITMFSLVLAVPESITMFCSITSVTVIFFTSLITNFSPNSGQVGVSTSHLLLMRLSPHTSPTLRYVELQLCTALQFFSLPSQIHVFACCWHCSFACCWLCSCFTGSWVPSLAVFFFLTDSWVPTLAVFFLDHHSNFHH